MSIDRSLEPPMSPITDLDIWKNLVNQFSLILIYIYIYINIKFMCKNPHISKGYRATKIFTHNLADQYDEINVCLKHSMVLRHVQTQRIDSQSFSKYSYIYIAESCHQNININALKLAKRTYRI